jgi:hypothetical protein
MLQARPSASLAVPLLCVLVIPAVFVTARGQVMSGDTKLPLRAVLVLTPEFCGTTEAIVMPKATLEVGQAACAELEPALKSIFPNLTRVAEAGSSGDAEIVLLPRFANIGETTPAKPGAQDRELYIWLEWTLKDRSGKTVWIETVQSSGRHRIAVKVKKDTRAIVAESVKHVAEESVNKISSAPELRQFTQ